MTFTLQESALIAYALRLYRQVCVDDDDGVPTVPGVVANIDAVLFKLTCGPEPVEPEEYRGIGERHADCFCATCRTIIEGQVRALLKPLPIERRADLVDRVESSLTKGGST